MKYSELSQSAQRSVSKKFVLPENTNEVLVDEHLRPYIQDGGRLYCTLRKEFIVGEGFHNHELKNS